MGSKTAKIKTISRDYDDDLFIRQTVINQNYEAEMPMGS